VTARAMLAVYSRPATAEQDDEYNRWYDDVHIPQVLARVPGVKAAARYRLSPTQMAESERPPDRPYLTLYEIETDNLSGLRDRLTAALTDGTFDWSSALDMTDLGPVAHLYEPAD
jgi:hypothetical protein